MKKRYRPHRAQPTAAQRREENGDMGEEIIRELLNITSGHPTKIAVVERHKDYSSERTDSRPSEAYRVYGADNVLSLEFHEGCNPHDSLNGWLVEDLLAILVDRMEQHQAGPFASRENALAITSLQQAELWLHRRRALRVAAGTSGTQKV